MLKVSAQRGWIMGNSRRVTIEKNIKKDEKTGKLYVTFYYGRNDGLTIRKTKAFGTIEKARLALKEHQVSVIKRDAIHPSKLILNDAVDRHIDMLSLKSEATTIYGYKGIAKHIRNHSVGKKYIQEIKPTEIQDYLTYLQKERGLCGNSALKHYNLLNSVFNMLERHEQISRNPVTRVITPKKMRHEPEYLSVEEAKDLIVALKGESIELPFLIGIFTGMRRGEISGLKWECIDFRRNIIRIKYNRVSIGGQVIDKQPKSASSDRSINMVPELAEALKYEKQRQDELKLLMGNDFHDEGYVLCFNDGTPIRPNYISEKFKAWFGRKENAHYHAISPHELRHTFVAIAIAASVPLYEISKALGHNDVTITSRIYAHLLDSTHKNATESMAGMLR